MERRSPRSEGLLDPGLNHCGKADSSKGLNRISVFSELAKNGASRKNKASCSREDEIIKVRQVWLTRIALVRRKRSAAASSRQDLCIDLVLGHEAFSGLRLLTGCTFGRVATENKISSTSSGRANTREEARFAETSMRWKV